MLADIRACLTGVAAGPTPFFANSADAMKQGPSISHRQRHVPTAH